MRNLVVLTLIALTFAGATQAADIEKGKQLADSQCIACHGGDGNSVNPIWPKLAGQNAKYLVKQLKNFKSGMENKGELKRKNAVMGPLVLALSKADMENVAAFYASQGVTRQGVPEKYLERGQALYRAGDEKKGIPACTGCHGPKGNGLGEAKFPALAGQHAEYTVLQMKAFQTGERNNDPNKVMQEIAAKMSDQDIEAVSQFMLGLH